MLWTDGFFADVDDIESMDSELTDVCAIENIALTGPKGVVQFAKSECRSKLGRFMSFANFSPHDLSFRDTNMPIITPDLKYNYAGYGQIVVSGDSPDEWSAIKQWVAARTLLEAYSRAINKAKDRFDDRHERLKAKITEELWPEFRRRGLPIALTPLSCPGALEENVGFFTQNSLALVAGTGTSSVALDWAVTWVGSTYSSPDAKNNGESFRSCRVNFPLIAGNNMRVSIAGLTAPNGQQPTNTKSYCRYSTGVAVGWNIWAGDPGDPNQTMYRQNPAVIPLATLGYTLPGDPVLTGEILDLGQSPTVVLEIKASIARG